MNAADMIMRVVRGEAHWSSLNALGVYLSKLEDGWHWRMPSIPGTEVPVELDDIVTGAMVHRENPEARREWAAFLMASPPLLTWGGWEDTPAGDAILEALWDLTFGEDAVAELLQAAERARE